MTQVKENGACNECYFGCTKVCPSNGNEQSRFVVLGDHPTSLELVEGIPFTDDAGEFVRKILTEMGIALDDVYWMNAVSCTPVISNPKKKPEQMIAATKACNERLGEQLRAYPRDVILAFGNSALHAVTGNYDLKITQERGKLFECQFTGAKVVASVHPNFIRRGGGSLGKFKADISYAVDISRTGQTRSYVIPEEVLIDREDKVDGLIDAIYTMSMASSEPVEIGCDIETGGFDFFNDEILCIGIGWEYETAYIVTEEMIPYFIQQYQDRCFDPYMQKKITWIYQNGKFDVKFLRQHNMTFAEVGEDLMLAHYALEEKTGYHDLGTITSDTIGAPDYKKMLDEYLPSKKTSYREIPKDVLYKYGGSDVSFMLQAWHVIKAKVWADPLAFKLYKETLLPTAKMLEEVEERGMCIDPQRILENKERLEADLARMKAELPLNPNSPPQVHAALLEMGLIRRGQSTGKDILEKLEDADKTGLVKDILKYRKTSKILGTYVNGLIKKVNPTTGRIHATFNVHGSQTGRLSSSDPNLQNIPRDPQIRGQFVPRPKFVYAKVDINQAELRTLACASGDANLCAIYRDTKVSLHKEVSVVLWGEQWEHDYSLKDSTDLRYLTAYEQYMATKQLNFGKVYGITPQAVATRFNKPLEWALEMFEKWDARFPQAKAYIDQCRAAPIMEINQITPWGRRKRYNGIDPELAAYTASNEAANYPNQSWANDINLHVAIRMSKSPLLTETEAGIVNLVHDENIFEVPEDDTELQQAICQEAIGLVATIPIEYGLTAVPFVGEADIIRRWGDTA